MKRLIQAQLALAIVFGLGSLQAQAADPPFSSVQDWSSRSVIQSKPLFPDELQRAGNSVDAQKLYSDPRYLTAVMRRVEAELPISNQLQSSRQVSGMVARQTAAADCNDRRRGHCPSTPDPESLGEGEVTRDWSNVLGGGANGQGGRGAQGIFPAKYNFDIFAPPSCSNDFIVYTTNAAGATSSGAFEVRTGTMSSNNNNASGTLTVGTGVRSVILTAGTTNAGLIFKTNGETNTVEAANLAAAVNRWTGQTGISATSSGAVVTYRMTTTGNSVDIPVADNLSNYGNDNNGVTDGSGTPGQATVIAFNQLYNTTCNAGRTNTNAPNVMWSYNTGVGYIAETSPVLSFTDNGKQVAFVQRNGNLLQLVLLKGQTGQGTAGTPSAALTLSASAAAYRACVSGCYYVIPFSTTGGASNVNSTPTYSSPFVDYPGDILWVGDGNGRLHKFTGVFVGNPAEVTSGGFPKTVELGLKLSSPVFDYNNTVYVGNQSGSGTTGGKIHRINATTGATLAISSKLALASTTGVRESPIIDLRSQSLYAFVFNDDTSNYTDTAHCQAFTNEIDGCRAIIRLSTTFATNTNGTRQWIGRGNSVDRALYAGGFDDAFYNSEDGTGSMYITGGRANNTFYATLWKVPFNAGALGSPVAGPEIGVRDRRIDGTAGTGLNGSVDNLQNLSPVTVIKNPNTGFEYLYASTASWGNAAGCGAGTYASGCLYMYRLNQLVAGGSNVRETWTFRIERTGSIFNYNVDGIPASGGGGITVDGNLLTAGVNFSSSGNRSVDRDALVAAISAVTGYSAAASGGCSVDTLFASAECDFIVTRNAFGNVAATTVNQTLTNVSLTGNTDGDVAGSSVQPITWSPAMTAGAALPVNPNTGDTVANQVVGGTGGIVIDNVRPTSETGTSQIYYTQGGSTGNAIQASQSGLQ